jgi:hypothetical protein
LGQSPPAPEVLIPALTRLAGCATPTRFASQAPSGATTSAAPTLNLDHPVGADQRWPCSSPSRVCD